MQVISSKDNEFIKHVKKLKDTYDVDLVVKQDKKIKQGKSKVEIIKVYKDFLEEQ